MTPHEENRMYAEIDQELMVAEGREDHDPKAIVRGMMVVLLILLLPSAVVRFSSPEVSVTMALVIGYGFWLALTCVLGLALVAKNLLRL